MIKLRKAKDNAAARIMLGLTLFLILLMFLIGAGLLVKAYPLLKEHSLWSLLSSDNWKPFKGEFGFLPYIVGTIWVTGIAMIIAFPLSLLASIYLSEYAPEGVKNIARPLIDLLAGVPPVVYGVWGVLMVVPFLSEEIAPHFVEYSTGYCVLAGGIVLAIMTFPLIISIMGEVFASIPKELRDASLSLGATQWQTTKFVLLRKALPGIFAALILSISRALGETIAVLMVVGNVADIPHSLFDSAYPLPALIANNYGEMLSVPMYDSALMFAALILFVIIVVFNAISRYTLGHLEKKIPAMKKLEEKIFRVLMVLSTLIIVGSLFLILGTIISKGFSHLSWDMVSKIPEGGFYIGKGGGILNAIIGSFYIAGGSTLLSLFISIPIVIYINQYAKKNSWIGNTARMASGVLFGVPSIVYGAFGFALMILLGLKTSLLAGIVVVTLLVIPIMVRTIDEVFVMIPKELSEAMYSLGATKWETALVLLRQVAPGVFTAILLSFGRAIGDAATVLFTAGYTDSIPTSLSQPAATLPLAIFFQLSSPMEEVQGRAYAAALILTIIVLIINIMARAMNKKLSKHKVS